MVTPKLLNCWRTLHQEKRGMKTANIGHTIVKIAIEALQHANKEQWFQLFDASAELYHNGKPENLTSFFYPAFGFEHFNSIDSFNMEDLSIFGEFYSYRFGSFPAYMRFNLNEFGLIIRLEIGKVIL
jgi:hypothetical protein